MFTVLFHKRLNKFYIATLQCQKHIAHCTFLWKKNVHYIHTGYMELSDPVNALMKFRFEPLKIWSILWKLAPTGLHNLINEGRTFGRSRQSVATFDLFKYTFIIDTYKIQDQQQQKILLLIIIRILLNFCLQNYINHRMDCRKVISFNLIKI